MSRRQPDIALRHMLAHAREAHDLVQGRTRADLDTDRLLYLALTRLLEIVGEAATRIEPETRARYPAVPWRSVIGLRNRLIHGYDAVDLTILWSIAREDLPPLIAGLEEMLRDLDR